MPLEKCDMSYLSLSKFLDRFISSIYWDVKDSSLIIKLHYHIFMIINLEQSVSPLWLPTLKIKHTGLLLTANLNAIIKY